MEIVGELPDYRAAEVVPEIGFGAERSDDNDWLGLSITVEVDGVDLAVEPRSRAALVGRNGAGKSTLMKVVMGLIEPDSGDRSVRITAAQGSSARLKLAMMP